MCLLPGVELPQAAVQVLKRTNEESQAVDAGPVLVIEVGVQDEERVQLLAVSESCHQCWVVVQPESLAEPVNAHVSHDEDLWVQSKARGGNLLHTWKRETPRENCE